MRTELLAMLLESLEAHRLGKSRKLVVLNLALMYARRKMAPVGAPQHGGFGQPAGAPPRAA